MTMPDTTPIPNEIANILIQKLERRKYMLRFVKKLIPSNTAIKEANPMVNAGSKIWKAITQANCKRDKKRGSRFIINFPKINSESLKHLYKISWNDNFYIDYQCIYQVSFKYIFKIYVIIR